MKEDKVLKLAIERVKKEIVERHTVSIQRQDLALYQTAKKECGTFSAAVRALLRAHYEVKYEIKK